MEDNKYYLIIEGEQRGPFLKEELIRQGLTLETPVWRYGMEDWKRASELPELQILLEGEPVRETFQPRPPHYGQQPPVNPYNTAPVVPETEYYAMIADIRMGPAKVDRLLAQGLTLDTPVWTAGMADWIPARNVPEIVAYIAAAPTPGSPVYGAPPTVNVINNPYPATVPHTNWLPWAIVATVLSLGSCIGIITGVIAIVYADKANTAYNGGDTVRGDEANSTAKIMTIVTFGLIVLGVVVSLLFGLLPIVSLFSSFSYL